MRILHCAFVFVVIAACGGSSPAGGPGSDAGKDASPSGDGGGGPGTPDSGKGSTDSSAGADGGGGGGDSETGGGTTLPTAGNPYGSCKTLTLPSEAQAVDTTHPTVVVGTGTPASCTFSSLDTAVSTKGGGIITFNCGDGLVTIPVTATLTPAMSSGSEAPVNVVIDGGNKITLDGGSSVRIMSWLHPTWRTSMDTLTLQHIRLMNGKTTPTEKIPACPPSGGISNTMCSTGYDDGEGGALYMADGNLRVIDCTFADNQAALLGPDTGGGAIYLSGTAAPSYIASSTFQNNKASNAGAIGMLWAGAFIYNSLFDGNEAVGTGANNNTPSECTCMNNGQNQVGSGGNGGAIYKDGGDAVNLTICGDQIQNNEANEYGAGIFLTADGSNAELIIDDTNLKSNTSPIPYWNWCIGVSTDNPYTSGSSTCSPAPVDSDFCGDLGDAGETCSMTCGS
jgi:hypothetical protein